MRIKAVALCFSLWLQMAVLATANDDAAYRGNYEILDKNNSFKFESAFKSNDIHRQRIDAETVKASSQVVVGIVQSQTSIRMVPEAYGSLIVSTGTFDLFISTGLCDTCWRKVRVAQ